MADYNIYIRTIGGGENSSPVTPFQSSGDDDSFKGAKQFISKTGAFMENPDSAVGAVKSAAVGTISKIAPAIGIAVLAGATLTKIGTGIADKYFAYSSSTTGDFKGANTYSNIKQLISNIFHPFSVAHEVAMAKIETRKQNERLKQEQLLTGGTILNSQYGRYL